MEKPVYFSKVPGKGLATLVWDPGRNKPLAEFDRQGLYRCDDQMVADKLREMGYAEVTREQIEEFGYMVPEALADNALRQAGRGYQHSVGDSTTNFIGQKGPMPIGADLQTLVPAPSSMPSSSATPPVTALHPDEFPKKTKRVVRKPVTE